MKERGKLFVVEGGVGCGKSTQLDLLSQELGNDWNFYREPGGTEFGELVRHAVQSRMGKKGDPYLVDPYAAFFGYSAARANLIRGFVIPDLKNGIDVGLDRYWFSTFGYQGSEGVSKPIIWAVSYIATKGLLPDVVLHYDLLPQIGIARKDKASDIDRDRYDVKALEFHQRVRKNYHQLKRLYPVFGR
ncbi:MAG: Thymidylate kinase [Candidatus Woesebacteria bacterium GW2011_GWB1_45_5]|uniref:Thymidylate kinase n=1 Tax=Candidatus Woesebacteria bacterium GW2011_GWB1_45_5 TaxID=1618581 RepID=A0A0G1QNE2_9BACT|nr:MAG: Thymidylate kinase [Candidatus Woesebacteria bacterium GW2011_GWB1_45_5]